MSEADLVIKSQRGDRAAFEELVRNTGRLVFSRAYLETGDVHRAEDLAQETYLIAWRSVRQISEPAGFRAWLMSILHSVVIDSARRTGRKKRAGARAMQDELHRAADDRPQPDESAETKEQRQRALSVLRSLPEEYRQVLTLHYLAGADYDTIARQLALSNGSLRGLLHRGMAMLRSQMSAGERNGNKP